MIGANIMVIEYCDIYECHEKATLSCDKHKTNRCVEHDCRKRPPPIYRYAENRWR